MTRSLVFSKHCPNCGGDIQFGITLDGPVLKCLQCTRVVSADQAKAMLAQLQSGQRAPEPVAVGAGVDDAEGEAAAVAVGAGARAGAGDGAAGAVAVADRRLAA